MNNWLEYPCPLQQLPYDLELINGRVLYQIEPINSPTRRHFYAHRIGVLHGWQVLRVRLTSNPIDYMADFNKAYAITALHEGGWANHVADTGGETMRGVSRNNFPNWEGWQIVDELKRQPGFPASANANPELKTLAASFYKANFWDVFRLDTVVDQKIANELFDTAVNMGTSRAATFLQRALNVTNNKGQRAPDVQVDGKVGPATIGALNKHADPGMVLKVLNILQGEFYVRLAERSSSQEVFMKSWLSRVTV